MEREWQYIVPNASPDNYDTQLGATNYRLVGRAGTGKKSAALGGMCLVTTGDLAELRKGKIPGRLSYEEQPIKAPKDILEWINGMDYPNYLEYGLPRVDQVLDAVGPSEVETTCVVFEDNLFGELIGQATGFDTPRDIAAFTDAMREVSERSVKYINRWLTFATGRPAGIMPVYTSDIWPEMQREVRELAQEMGKPEFLERRQAPVDLMYTYRWAELLKEKGYIDDTNVVCIEPFRNFTERLKQSTNTPTYLIGYFKRNPWGGEGKNQNFAVAGYLPMLRTVLADDGTRGKRTGKSKFSKYYKQPLAWEGDQIRMWKNTVESDTPFPLRSNPAFRAALELGYANPHLRAYILELLEIERGYRREKKNAKGNRLDINNIREEYVRRISNTLELLSAETFFGIYQQFFGVPRVDDYWRLTGTSSLNILRERCGISAEEG